MIIVWAEVRSIQTQCQKGLQSFTDNISNLFLVLLDLIIDYIHNTLNYSYMAIVAVGFPVVLSPLYMKEYATLLASSVC